MKKVTQTLPIRVLLVKGKSSWVAQCLEYDLAAQGKTIRKAKHAFLLTFASQVALDVQHGRRPLEQFSEAPRRYWDEWEESEAIVDRGDQSALEKMVPLIGTLQPSALRISPQLRVYG
jgi:hypothetical protein